jgi:hypothetical protein
VWLHKVSIVCWLAGGECVGGRASLVGRLAGGVVKAGGESG